MVQFVDTPQMLADQDKLYWEIVDTIYPSLLENDKAELLINNKDRQVITVKEMMLSEMAGQHSDDLSQLLAWVAYEQSENGVTAQHCQNIGELVNASIRQSLFALVQFRKGDVQLVQGKANEHS